MSAGHPLAGNTVTPTLSDVLCRGDTLLRAVQDQRSALCDTEVKRCSVQYRGDVVLCMVHV